MRTAFVAAALGAAALTLAGCGRAGAPELPNGHKPPLVTPPNAVAVTKEQRPYGDSWDYPHRHGVFQIEPPPREPKKPDKPFFLDFLL
jgi:predicted small lipoprotein YifL